MTMPAAAAYYGLPSALPAPPSTSTAPASAGAPQASSPSTTPPTGLHQDPVFVLVLLIGAAFVLARGAEHGLSLGFRVGGK
jgi:hypothetical protein